VQRPQPIVQQRPIVISPKLNESAECPEGELYRGVPGTTVSGTTIVGNRLASNSTARVAPVVGTKPIAPRIAPTHTSTHASVHAPTHIPTHASTHASVHIPTIAPKLANLSSGRAKVIQGGAHTTVTPKKENAQSFPRYSSKPSTTSRR